MIKNKIFSIFFFVIIFLIIFVNGKEFTLFDLSETHKFYTTKTNICYTVFIVLATNSTEPINNLNSGIGCSISSQNNTATLFTCTSYVYVGTNQINFSVNNDILKDNLTIDFKCKGKY